MSALKKRRILVLIMLVLAIAVPAFIVLKNESFLSDNNSVYRFSLRPVDPYDPIRGKYIILRFNSQIESNEPLMNGQSIYVTVDRDSSKLAFFKNIQTSIPDHDAYFESRVIYVYEKQVQFEIPFDRYYMNEHLAQRAENLYNEFSQNGEEFYADVHIKNGKALLKEVYYKGEALNEYLKNHP